MDFFLITSNVFFTVYSAYAWKKYQDTDFKWLFLLGVLACSFLFIRIFGLLLLPDNIKPLINLVRYTGWVFILAALTVLFFPKQKH